MPLVPVSKLHGTYNDFVVLDQRSSSVPDLISFARHACNRRTAIGADGLLAILPSQIADARMRIINADGSEAEMCGNGIRCVARFLNARALGDEFRIETLAGVIQTKIVSKTPEFLVRVNMGIPDLQDRAIPFPNSACVSMGNPHVVLFMDAVDTVDLPEIGRKVEQGASFPDGTNVHIAQRTGPGALRVRHWERGVGL
ncbi:MAG: diaminopimelate epimerase, partial [Candidatus Baltobacteraceae bacterium]